MTKVDLEGGKDYVVKANSSFLDKLTSTPGTHSNPNQNSEVLKIRERISEIIQKNGSIGIVEGIYGDGVNLSAYLEEGYPMRTPDGWVSKFLGCSYEYKGRVDARLIDSAATVKRVVMEGLRLAAKHPIRFLGKRFREDLIDSFLSIYDADMVKMELPYREFNRGQREILRVLLILAKPFGKRYERLAYVFCMFLQADNAYWQRLQDAFVSCDLTFLSLLDVLIERDNENTIEKFKLTRRIVRLLGFLPSFRSFEKDFFLELGSEVYPDKADRYFTLNRRGYNFNGLPYDFRHDKWLQINKEKGHVILGI